MRLIYGSKGFATRAKQLIAMQTPFTIVVGDPAARELAGRIEAGGVVDWSGMTANPHVRVLVAVVMVAAASGASYQIRHAEGELVVTVSWGAGGDR